MVNHLLFISKFHYVLKKLSSIDIMKSMNMTVKGQTWGLKGL